jgi:calcineurin-like phosphoesterase family protein
MTIIRFIGVVHGRFEDYVYIAESSPDHQSIQVGDFGIGFPGSKYDFLKNMSGYHRFIRGNHDNLEVCRKFDDNPKFIPDGTILDYEGTTILFIGGAMSIDKKWRTPGVSWWPDEELSYTEWDTILGYVEDHGKPFDIVVSHECPETLCRYVDPNYNPIYWPSHTRKALDHIWQTNKPKIWFHGHWHTQKYNNILGTEFFSLGELEYVDVEI